MTFAIHLIRKKYLLVAKIIREMIGIPRKLFKDMSVLARNETHDGTVANTTIIVRPVLDNAELPVMAEKRIKRTSNYDVEVKKKTRTRQTVVRIE